jgi:tRNA-splicing ligase RtcB
MRPIKMWFDEVEAEAMQQAYNLAALPFAFHHIALMADCHGGYGMPIGGVLATEGVVIPNAVGVDISCGMAAVATSLDARSHAGDTAAWKTVMGEIRDVIPVGRDHRKEPADRDDMPHVMGDLPIVQKEFDAARYQLGTLGGGNHFIEIQKGSDGFIWIMLHSGSRNVGYKVAQHYNNVAVGLNQRWKTAVPKHVQLAFLPLDTDEGRAYLAEMNWCVEFAFRNRMRMMHAIQAILIRTFPQITFCGVINVAHNYAAIEHHFGKNVMVHRKGATRARAGETGIIPGSQGTCSYIVEGLGNPESFHSCSHGAGRTMSRSAARARLDLEAEQAKMAGVVHGIRTQSDLDEAPGAYKDINSVMAQQADLVKPVVELRPIAVIKG